MKLTIPNENEKVWTWAYKNGINKYDAEFVYKYYYDGFVMDGDEFPELIELEINLINEGSTRHAYGSTSAVENHGITIEAFYNDNPVTVPRWLEDKIMEMV